MSEHAAYDPSLMMKSVAYAQTSAPKAPGVMTELEEQVRQLSEAIDRLEAAIGPVLRPAEPEAEVDAFPRDTAIENVSWSIGYRAMRLDRICARVVL